jgi:hypothetical protein
MNELELLEHSVGIIKAWHGDTAFDIYYNCSPEMRPIKERINELKGQPKDSADECQCCHGGVSVGCPVHGKLYVKHLDHG